MFARDADLSDRLDYVALMASIDERRIFLDTEFTNLPWTGHSQLLWIGLADQDGQSWSAVNADVVVDEHASDFVRDNVGPLMSADEPRLSTEGLSSAVVEFCGDVVDEFWAYCPTVGLLADVFGLGDDAPTAHARYWDWDLQLLRQSVDVWPAQWATTLCDLNAMAKQAGIELPNNDSAHHPRHDALWNLEVWRKANAASSARP